MVTGGASSDARAAENQPATDPTAFVEQSERSSRPRHVIHAELHSTMKKGNRDGSGRGATCRPGSAAGNDCLGDGPDDAEDEGAVVAFVNLHLAAGGGQHNCKGRLLKEQPGD